MIDIDDENATLDIPDLGLTLRSIFAAARSGYDRNPKRIWKLRYRTVIVGTIRLRTHNIKEI